jgi:hypothetical protein
MNKLTREERRIVTAWKYSMEMALDMRDVCPGETLLQIALRLIENNEREHREGEARHDKAVQEASERGR